MDWQQKIIFVSPFFYPELISTGKANQHLAEAFVAEGHGVTVVCSHPLYPAWVPVHSNAKIRGIEILRGGARMRYPKAMPLRRLLLEAFLGPGLFNLVLALSITGWVGYARLVRAQVLAAREREFVEAARAMGATDLRIMTRHILPNIIQPVMVQAAIGMAGTILAEATLSFLGLGVPPPMPSWGVMLNDARAHLFDAPHMVIFPAIAIMLAVLSFNFIGDSLRDQLDPRTRIAVGVSANY